jgi:hypothetical protein
MEPVGRSRDSGPQQFRQAKAPRSSWNTQSSGHIYQLLTGSRPFQSGTRVVESRTSTYDGVPSINVECFREQKILAKTSDSTRSLDSCATLLPGLLDVPYGIECPSSLENPGKQCPCPGLSGGHMRRRSRWGRRQTVSHQNKCSHPCSHRRTNMYRTRINNTLLFPL